MQDLHLKVLRTDVAGMPLEWINYQQAAKLHALDQVVYDVGQTVYRIHGGISAVSGQRSRITVRAVIATCGVHPGHGHNHPAYSPPLCNTSLFKRDQNLCLYCGDQFRDIELSRDHVTPISRGGQDIWSNVVTACKRCNNHKADRSPEQAGLELIAIPFIPTHAEYIFLQSKQILADQMDFLLAHFPRNSPLLERIDKSLIEHEATGEH